MATHTPSTTRPKIMIVGAGLGGLTLAILLERAGMDYRIYEKSTALKIPGGLTSLSTNVLQAMEQLGLIEDLIKISKPTHGYSLFKEMSDGRLEPIGEIDISTQKATTGYPTIIMRGSDLHALLLSRVPRNKIELGKRVLSMSQEPNNGVLIRTSDGAIHQGDILVGCDGTYSAVRQSLYKNLTKEGVLPSSDNEDLRVSHLCYIGTTGPLDPAVVPEVAKELSCCNVIIGHNKPQTWRCFTIPGNRVGWRVDVQLQSSDFSKSEAFRNTDWDSESIKSMDESWRAFKVPLGANGKYLTIGDLIDATPKDQISKTVLEEKLFTTWYNRRTVLVGDACHKMLPNAGKALVNAMLDAVVLANELYEIAEDATSSNIQNAFKEYYKDRYIHAKADFETSHRLANHIAGQSKTDAIIRKAVYSYTLTLLQPRSSPKLLTYRRQVSFLPRVENRGTDAVEPQKESKRYERLRAAAAAV